MWHFTGFESNASSSNVISVIQAVAWPLVIVTLVFIYRREIPRLIEALGGRMSKLSAVGVTLEFAAAQPVPETLRVRLEDIREPASGGAPPPSGADSLIQLARSTAPVDYVLIDLREGGSWLTSRLYLFAVVLPSYSGPPLLCFRLFPWRDSALLSWPVLTRSCENPCRGPLPVAAERHGRGAALSAS